MSKNSTNEQDKGLALVLAGLGVLLLYIGLEPVFTGSLSHNRLGSSRFTYGFSGFGSLALAVSFVMYCRIFKKEWLLYPAAIFGLIAAYSLLRAALIHLLLSISISAPS